MPNNSASGGYLTPAAAPSPVEGDAFDDFLHDVIAGVTGMSGELIRPRWQQEPTNMPQADQTWCAFGITDFTSDTYAVEQMNSDGSFEMIRHETNQILVSFFGPSAIAYAGILRDGLQISQNRTALVAAGVGMVNTGNPIQVPSLVKERWQKRVDLPWTVRRQILRSYPVLHLLTANAILVTDTTPQLINPIDVQQ